MSTLLGRRLADLHELRQHLRILPELSTMEDVPGHLEVGPGVGESFGGLPRRLPHLTPSGGEHRRFSRLEIVEARPSTAVLGPRCPNSAIHGISPDIPELDSEEDDLPKVTFRCLAVEAIGSAVPSDLRRRTEGLGHFPSFRAWSAMACNLLNPVSDAVQSSSAAAIRFS